MLYTWEKTLTPIEFCMLDSFYYPILHRPFCVLIQCIYCPPQPVWSVNLVRLLWQLLLLHTLYPLSPSSLLTNAWFGSSIAINSIQVPYIPGSLAARVVMWYSSNHWGKSKSHWAGFQVSLWKRPHPWKWQPDSKSSTEKRNITWGWMPSCSRCASPSLCITGVLVMWQKQPLCH